MTTGMAVGSTFEARAVLDDLEAALTTLRGIQNDPPLAGSMMRNAVDYVELGLVWLRKAMAEAFPAAEEGVGMAKGVIAEECIAELDAVESQVRELEALTNGSMHGEMVYPDARRYASIYAILAWLKEHCGCGA